jgi:hypothetical protein
LAYVAGCDPLVVDDVLSDNELAGWCSRWRAHRLLIDRTADPDPVLGQGGHCSGRRQNQAASESDRKTYAHFAYSTAVGGGEAVHRMPANWDNFSVNFRGLD